MVLLLWFDDCNLEKVCSPCSTARGGGLLARLSTLLGGMGEIDAIGGDTPGQTDGSRTHVPSASSSRETMSDGVGPSDLSSSSLMTDGIVGEANAFFRMVPTNMSFGRRDVPVTCHTGYTSSVWDYREDRKRKVTALQGREEPDGKRVRACYW